MPAYNHIANRRRRSSAMVYGLTPARPGVYGAGLPLPSQKPVMFAPNVTPVTYVEPEDGDDGNPPSPSSTLFPPSEAPSTGPTRRRAPPGKRRSLGYIPRPPNAFMLFRADFVRQKHVPGSIETNHGSLSKIIGNCWRALPLEEKRVWEVKAKQAKAEHKAKYPNYRFRPVHNKNKDKKKDKVQPTMEDERRCEEVAQLLLEGKKGEELADALRRLDSVRTQTPVMQPGLLYAHRRSSSVPLPSDYYSPYGHVTIPPPPFLATRPPSPIARQQRLTFGQQRRPSSAGPVFFRSSWGQNQPINTSFLNNDPSPLPEPDPALYNSFSTFNFRTSFPDHDEQPPPYNVSELMATLPPHEQQSHDSQLALGPLEPLAPEDILSRMYTNNSTPPESNNNASDVPDLDMTSWFSSSLQQSPGLPSSHASTTSESPQPFDGMLPLPVFAPQPIHPDQTPTNAMFGNVESIVSVDWPGHPMEYEEHSLGYQPDDGNCADGSKFSFSHFDFGDYVKNGV
ncbi:hypothetical protein AGABI1DRAFT_109486 [Agaricus bisporus var. burnettii JB137-S8]|nr:uncharacterized protein AGABI1DRAFT_109486 [Agaricus bisporus var. burnettii JB137-S8]EKM75303.1 hypothetical protein AGABI1DRAFT_109486 [Agaricus bisporus var. burnettii JB137-S8]